MTTQIEANTLRFDDERGIKGYAVTLKEKPRGKLKLVNPQDKMEAAERWKLWIHYAR